MKASRQREKGNILAVGQQPDVTSKIMNKQEKRRERERESERDRERERDRARETDRCG